MVTKSLNTNKAGRLTGMATMSQVVEFTGVSPSNAQGVWAFNPAREAWSRHSPDSTTTSPPCSHGPSLGQHRRICNMLYLT